LSGGSIVSSRRKAPLTKERPVVPNIHRCIKGQGLPGAVYDSSF
jgi:hypothetical protein